ncbi:MAG: metallophosphoesterase family protein [Planctomycetes bacterium]|nr:metallophosphoesterase family protein [Planctomycetota bacterium]
MLKAIISDIHANIEAFREVLAHIDSQGIGPIVCLGDVVGYGPDPTECMALAQKLMDQGRLEVILMGNHEEAVLFGAFGFHPAAKEAIDWTRAQLKPKWFHLGGKKARWEVLRSMPLTYNDNGTLFVHGSPRDPTMEYILRSDTEDLFGEVPEKIQQIFDLVDSVCFVGHTHDPGIITQESKFHRPTEFGMRFETEPGKKYIVNVGSVGQPRDKNPNACYVTHDERAIQYHRIPYDVKKTAEKIRRIPQLDNRNADRLEQGN